MRWALALALSAVPVPVLSQEAERPIPWDGFWTSTEMDCRQADRYEGAQVTSETLCVGLSARLLATEAAWLVEMRCDEEGRVWTAPRLVLLDEDRMWIWFGPGGLGAIALKRCASSKEY